jgi:hypothetical protein
MKPIPAPPSPEGTPGEVRLGVPHDPYRLESRAAEGRAEVEAGKLRGPARHSAFARLRRAAAIVIPKFTEVCGSGNTLLAHYQLFLKISSLLNGYRQAGWWIWSILTGSRSASGSKRMRIGIGRVRKCLSICRRADEQFSLPAASALIPGALVGGPIAYSLCASRWAIRQSAMPCTARSVEAGICRVIA